MTFEGSAQVVSVLAQVSVGWGPPHIWAMAQVSVAAGRSQPILVFTFCASGRLIFSMSLIFFHPFILPRSVPTMQYAAQSSNEEFSRRIGQRFVDATDHD